MELTISGIAGVLFVALLFGGAWLGMSQLVLEGAATTARAVATERVPATCFDDYSEGQSFEIVYLPRFPSISASREMVDKIRNTSGRLPT